MLPFRSFAWLVFSLASGAALLAAGSPRAKAPIPIPRTVQTTSGPVVGAAGNDARIRIFEGIPYAAPPVGDLRWKPPQPLMPWTAPRRVATFGPRCMQGRIYSDMVFRDNGPSEDCLTLNIWTPAKSPTAKLPVMIWIYGGGFAAGGTSEPRQDGEALARKGVVVVSMNYRLGIFGFFVSQELKDESPQHASGNYGLLDQLAAIRWVHENIVAFGGDPSNVTVFGESAGSFSVSAQLATPLSQGLITRAIGESGSLFGRGLQRASWTEAAEQDRAFAQQALGTDSLAALRAKSGDELLKAALKERSTVRFSTVVDGYFLPESVANAYEDGKQAHVPLLAGWNADEQGPKTIFGDQDETAANFKEWVQKHYGDKSETLLRAYPAATDAQAKESAGNLASDLFIAYGTWKWIEVHAATCGCPVYRYRFEDAPPMKGGASRGAYHSAEIEFVFEALRSKPLPWRPEDKKLSDLMSTYWTNFAKTGDPNGRGLPFWPSYQSRTKYQVMHLNANPKAAPAENRERYETLDKLGPPSGL